jgi:hypothetical protein
MPKILIVEDDTLSSKITATTLLAMAAAMDSVVGPMGMIPDRTYRRKGNKYAGMKKFSGAKETERRMLRAQSKGVA